MRIPRRARSFVGVLAALALTIPAAHAADPPPYTFAGPTFGIAANPNGGLLVADSGAGIVKLRKSGGHLFAALPGVTDMDATGRSMWAITSDVEGEAFRVRANGTVRTIADLHAFEAAVNPDGGEIDGCAKLALVGACHQGGIGLMGHLRGSCGLSHPQEILLKGRR